MKGKRVGVVKEGFEKCADDVINIVKAAANTLTKAGAVVEEVSIPMHSDGIMLLQLTRRYFANCTFGPGHAETCLLSYANNKGADQPQSDQHLCCSLLRQYDMYTCYIQGLRILTGFCSWAGWFESYLVKHLRRHIFAWCGSFYNVVGLVTIIACFQMEIIYGFVKKKKKIFEKRIELR